MPKATVIELASVRAGRVTLPPFPLGLAASHGGPPAPVIGLGRAAHGWPRCRRVLMMAAAASVMLHAAAAWAVIFHAPAIEMEGAGGEHEGVSVELVAGTAVESVASASQEPAAAAADINAASGEDAPRDQAALTDTDPAPREKSEPLPPETSPPDADTVAAARTEPENEPERDTPQPEDGKSEADVRQTAQEALSAGGAASRGAAEASAATEASVAASPGEMSRYAAGLHAALIRNRPRHAGYSGRVTILFALTHGGEVRSAEVARSSGGARLDRLALDAIRRIRFPPPPRRANENQLRYTTTIVFR